MNPPELSSLSTVLCSGECKQQGWAQTAGLRLRRAGRLVGESLQRGVCCLPARAFLSDVRPLVINVSVVLPRGMRSRV